MHAYCLFCETAKCGFIALLIEQQYGFRCLSPKIIQRKWIKGVCREECHSWLPGYVFVYAEEPIVPNFEIPGILRWLGRDELQGEDLAFAKMLYSRDGIMGTIHLAEVGDRCVIDDSAWEGIVGTITKIDRGRKRCCVAFEFDGVQRTVWLGYEMVKKAETAEKTFEQEHKE